MSGEWGTLRSNKETQSDCMELQKEQAVKRERGASLVEESQRKRRGEGRREIEHRS